MSFSFCSSDSRLKVRRTGYLNWPVCPHVLKGVFSPLHLLWLQDPTPALHLVFWSRWLNWLTAGFQKWQIQCNGRSGNMCLGMGWVTMVPLLAATKAYIKLNHQLNSKALFGSWTWSICADSVSGLINLQFRKYILYLCSSLYQVYKHGTKMVAKELIFYIHFRLFLCSELQACSCQVLFGSWKVFWFAS